MMNSPDKIKIELEPYEAKKYVQYQQFYFQFNRMLDKGIFNKDFTGRVILDILQGDIKHLDKISSYHFQIKI